MRFLRRYLSRWQNWIGLLLALSFTAIAVAAPLLSPQDEKNPGPFKVVGRSTDITPRPPGENPEAILGTLPGQYDVFHTLIWGARDAMRFGLSVAVIAFIFGIFFGAVAGYAGGALNAVMMRIADAFLTFPPLAGVVFFQQLVAISITALGGMYYFNTQFYGKLVIVEGTPPPAVTFLSRMDPVLISLILFSWMPYARLVNTIVITLKQMDFIQAARALGSGSFWVIRKHLLPNSISPAIALAARDVGNAVILQATITFIGMGGASPWGTLLAMGRNWIMGSRADFFGFWWVYAPITVVIILFGITWNLIGDGMSDTLAATSIHVE